MKEKINFYGYPIDLTYGKGQKNIYLRIHPSQGKISLSLDQRLGKQGALAFSEDFSRPGPGGSGLYRGGEAFFMGKDLSLKDSLGPEKEPGGPRGR